MRNMAATSGSGQLKRSRAARSSAPARGAPDPHSNIVPLSDNVTPVAVVNVMSSRGTITPLILSSARLLHCPDPYGCQWGLTSTRVLRCLNQVPVPCQPPQRHKTRFSHDKFSFSPIARPLPAPPRTWKTNDVSHRSASATGCRHPGGRHRRPRGRPTPDLRRIPPAMTTTVLWRVAARTPW